MTELTTVVSLFESGSSLTDIAIKCNITKQAVSDRLRRYYSKRPEVLVIDYITRTCKVCGVEDTSVYKKTSILQLKQLRYRSQYKHIHFLCPLCKEQHLYVCTICGTVGRLGQGFLRSPIHEHNRRGRCVNCNRHNRNIWKLKSK